MRMPHVVAREQWQAARDELLVKEKHLIADDWLAAARRRLHDEYSTVKRRTRSQGCETSRTTTRNALSARRTRKSSAARRA